MDKNLGRRLVPRSKYSCSLPATAATAPAAQCLLHPQVLGRKQMAIAANIGYVHGLADTFLGKANHMSFGCFKARPRYHFWLHPNGADCSATLAAPPRPAH
jgi:hypothetical protein